MRKKLIKLREECGYTQYTMAEAVNCSRSHYSQIETGEKTPALELAVKIKTVLGYTNDDLFFDYKSPLSRPCIDKNKKKRRR